MNQILESVYIALGAVWTNKLRSFMTVLGNIVAVTSIVTVVTLIQGMNAMVSTAIISDVGADSFTIQRQPNGEEGMLRYHTREAPVAENNWVGDNKGRYMNSEMDALLDRYFVTIARGDRVQIASQIVQHMSGQAVPLGLFYDANAIITSNRVQNVTPVQVAWNAHEWTARP